VRKLIKIEVVINTERLSEKIKRKLDKDKNQKS
jgi:hypothetical protein